MRTFNTLTKDFDWVNSDIEANFPLEERKHGEYKLFHFDRYISSEDAIEEMKKKGYVPVTLLELLEWKKWNGKDWVVALGSVAEVDGRLYVPYLGGDGSERYLYLGWWGDVWDAYYRFLGVALSSETKSSEKALKPLDALTPIGKVYRKKDGELVIKLD